jgi:hypothetical protein
VQAPENGAEGGIRTHEGLRHEVLNLTPLTWLGNPCTVTTHAQLENNPYLAAASSLSILAPGRTCTQTQLWTPWRGNALIL